jgi:hypothetical protein
MNTEVETVPEIESGEKMKFAPLCPSTLGDAIVFVTITQVSTGSQKHLISSDHCDQEAWALLDVQKIEPGADH